MTAASRPRGRTRLGRSRSQRLVELLPTKGRRLLRGVDHGPPIRVCSDDVGAGKRNERWVEPFLDANRAQLRRLLLEPVVAYEGEVVVHLHPGPRIGAAALVSPTSRKVAAGVIISPRFQWSALADVVGQVGFAVEPRIGSDRLVPGSARDVPAWLIAGPVLKRLELLLRRTRRTFVEQRETRSTPRGRIEWDEYLHGSIATGRWHHLPCRFSGPEEDPRLLANIRWTIGRVVDSLGTLAPTPIGRSLLNSAQELLTVAGPGPRIRPELEGMNALGGEIVTHALEAMGWIADERGLGGARTLDGLAWDLAVDVLWEHWVARVMRVVGPRFGFGVRSGEQTRRHLQWHGPFKSMQTLVPDVELTRSGAAVWVDAKYKPHLMLLARKSWRDLHEQVRDAHRADLHQALAYAALANVDRVDTILAYPTSSEDADGDVHYSVATVASGTRRVRLLLAGLPFGFRSSSRERNVIDQWGRMLQSSS